jgi:hypothetical protein
MSLLFEHLILFLVRSSSCSCFSLVLLLLQCTFITSQLHHFLFDRVPLLKAKRTGMSSIVPMKFLEGYSVACSFH